MNFGELFWALQVLIGLGLLISAIASMKFSYAQFLLK